MKRPDEIDDAIDCLEQAEIEQHMPDDEDPSAPQRPRKNIARSRQFTV